MAAKKSWSAGVVWIHGLGDTGAGWSFIEQEVGPGLAKRLGGPLKWLFPTAPQAPVTCNGGAPCTSWMDLDTIPVRPGCTDHADDIKASMKLIHTQVEALEAEGIPSNKIVVGGFSQGGAMSLLSTLSYPNKLAGGVVLSGWAAMQDEWPSMIRVENKATPVLWCHGGADPVVSPECQVAGVAALEKVGVPIQSETYPGVPHSACNEEFDDVADFMAKVLAD